MVGTSLGTPTYMAPEQIAADPAADHRGDIYAFGTMAYEMLAGRPPFHGRTQQQLLTAHLAETPPPLTEKAPHVPATLAALVMRCLAKSPAERPASATEIVQSLDGIDVSGDWRTTSGGIARARRTRRLVAGFVALATLTAIGIFVGPRVIARPHALDPTVVAVVPFRIASADPSHHYLREGMLDLLAAKLTGEGGLRATEPRTLLAAWRGASGAENVDLAKDGALRVARTVGAGRLLLGEVVGTPKRLVLSATLLRVPGGEQVTRVNVEGAPDSLAWLVDRLAARLLTEVSGEGEQRAASLTSTSLDALRAYLDGQAKLRRGQVQAAAEEFTRALEADSNFALAGIGLHQASSWYGDASSQERGLRVAWRGRDRLGPRDQALLDAVAGPDFPRRSASAEVLRARERYLNIAPDRPDAWYLLGDHLFHFGQIYEMENHRRRALDAFRRASELDSTYVVPFIHGADLAVLLDDTATARRFERLRLAADTSRTWMAMHRWFVAAHAGDTATAHAIRDSLIAAQDQSVAAVWQHMFYDGTGASDVPVVIAAFDSLARERGGGVGFNRLAHDALLVLGRPTAARARVDSMFTQDAEVNALIVRVRDALVGGGDSADGAQAARALETRLRAPMPNDSVRRVYSRAILRMLEPWRLAQGDTSSARRTLEALDALARGDSTATSTDALMDVAVIRAMYADATRKPTARAELERLDSLMRALDYQGAHAGRTQMASLVAARLFERAGDARRALAAVQRRGDMWSNGLLYLPAQLREEGRLAARLGQREQAIAAYRHYLALRFDPEPRLRDEAEQVRRELAALLQEREGR